MLGYLPCAIHVSVCALYNDNDNDIIIETLLVFIIFAIYLVHA